MRILVTVADPAPNSRLCRRYMMANFCNIKWTMVGQAFGGAGDVELRQAVNSLAW